MTNATRAPTRRLEGQSPGQPSCNSTARVSCGWSRRLWVIWVGRWHSRLRVTPKRFQRKVGQSLKKSQRLDQSPGGSPTTDQDGDDFQHPVVSLACRTVMRVEVQSTASPGGDRIVKGAGKSRNPPDTVGNARVARFTVSGDCKAQRGLLRWRSFFSPTGLRELQEVPSLTVERRSLWTLSCDSGRRDRKSACSLP